MICWYINEHYSKSLIIYLRLVQVILPGATRLFVQGEVNLRLFIAW
jgi:hypothetical protein